MLRLALKLPIVWCGYNPRSSFFQLLEVLTAEDEHVLADVQALEEIAPFISDVKSEVFERRRSLRYDVIQERLESYKKVKLTTNTNTLLKERQPWCLIFCYLRKDSINDNFIPFSLLFHVHKMFSTLSMLFFDVFFQENTENISGVVFTSFKL